MSDKKSDCPEICTKVDIIDRLAHLPYIPINANLSVYDPVERSYPMERMKMTTQKNKIIEDRWLSVDEICVYLGIKRDTVYKWIDEKDMPAHKAGRLWKFQKLEVDMWIRNGGAK